MALDISCLDIVDATQDGIPLTAETVDQLKIPPQRFATIRAQFHRVVSDIDTAADGEAQSLV